LKKYIRRCVGLYYGLPSTGERADSVFIELQSF